MATLQEYMARRQMQGRSTSGLFGQSSQGKYWWEREREDEDVLTAARRAGLYGSISNSTAAQEKDEAGFWEKTWETGVDVVGNILSGAAKSLEGVFDLGLGAVGAVGGIFDKGVRDEIRRWVEYDFTGENISSHFDRWSDDSIMNGSRAGRIAEGVIGGVGQLLPTVALSLATGGAALPSMLSVGASAAGNATEEAFRDGAGYYRGLGYGLVSGGVEMGTEKLFGGLGNLMGGGMLDNVTRSIAKTGAARVAKEAVGEAAEEALAELVNPLAKSIYKGRDALSAYGERDYWSGVGESALVGGLTSVAYGGTVGRWTKTSGKYADVQAVKDEIEAINKKRSNLEERGKLTAEAEAQASRAERANLSVLERILKQSDDKKRANLIKRGRLENLFESDGSIKESVIKRLDGAENSGASIYRREYYSSSLRGQEDVIERDLEAIGSKTGTVAKVFEGELDEVAQGNYKKLKRALAALNRAGGNNVSLVITEANDKYNGGLVDNRTIYLPVDQLESGDYAGTIVHEFTHFEEGTAEYSKMLDFLSSDDVTVDDGKGGRMILRERAEEAVFSKGYGINLEGIQAALDKAEKGEMVTADEAKAIRLYSTEVTAHESELLLGNEAFIDRIVREDGGFAEKIVSRVLSLDKAFAKLGDKEARAQHKIVRQAERLYLKAAEAAGNNAIQKMILAQVPELEEEKVRMSFAGEKAKTADKLRLETAKVMIENGADAEMVRKETGWFKGYDGKWRFEIDDAESHLIENPALQKHTDNGEVYFTGKISDIFDHNELFAAYPDLKDINIVIQKTELGVDAIYQPKSNYITLSIEQFKRHTKAYHDYLDGGRRAEIERIEASEDYKEYNKLYDDAVMDEMEPTAWLEAEKTAREKFYSSEIGKRYYQLMWGKDGFVGDKFEFGWSKAAKETLVHELQHAVQKREGFASGTNTRDANYDRNAGEIEARDAARRANMTAEERKNTRPDVDRKDVVLADNITVSYFAKNEYDEEIANIKPQLRHAQDQLNAMDIVFAGHIDKKFNSKTAMKQWAKSELKKYGFKADRQGFGEILFPERAIDDAIGHIKDQDEILPIIALFRVLKRGIKIAEHGDHKKRQKHTVTIAAPIEINGVRGNMGVVVNLTNNKYYVHRVIMPDGSSFKFDIKKDTNQEMRKGVPEGSLADATRFASINSIPHPAEKSTETTEKNLKNEKKVQMSLVEAANQQTSGDIDELMRSAGIEGDAAEIREDLAELYVKAENLAMDEDSKSGKAFVERVAKRIALNMARLGTVRDGETQEAMADRLREEILSRSAFADKREDAKKAEEAPKQAPKKEASDEPKPQKTGYTYDDIHGMMDEVKKGLTFETSGGKSIQGELYRNDLWDVNKKIYQTLKAGELRKKRDVAREVAEMIVETVKVKEKDAYGKQITKRLIDVLSDEGVEAAKQEIALDVAVQLGDKEAKKYNKRMGDLKHEVQSLSDMKKGRYVNAANYKGDTFKKALSELSRINWRGGLVSSKKIRERFSELAKWYTPNNPLYGSGGVKNEMYRQSIADALDFVSDSTRGVLTMEDIDAAEMILKYFKREIENYGTIYKNGKREDAMPQVKEYIGKVGLAKEVASKSGILQGLLRNKITRMIADPALIMREADSFIEGGFFTEQFKELRRGTIEAAVKEHEIAAEFVKFWETNKAYGKRYNDTEIKYGGKKIPLQEAISLYMTMKREHAFAGLAYAGFEIEGKAGTVNVSDGFGELVEKHKIDLINALPPEKALKMTKADEEGLHTGAIERAVADMQKELYAQFTAEDKRLITIMERGLEECREVKIKIDNILMGDSNVTGGYYFPIKRAGLAESIDVVSMFEGDRVSNLSFNKDTVKNAHKLLIEPVHIVYMRHVKAISLYDGLGVFTDNFNRMYNLNVSDSANNPRTIRTEIAQSNKFVKETMPYFKELKQDIEGISKKRSSERFYNDAVASIRSAYASYQLGANPKTWASQFSSLIASTSKLDVSSITKGMARRGKDVDKYCKLAWLRNNNGDAVLAQSVTTGMNPVQRSGRNALQKVRDVSMWLIGKVDRIVVERLFAACQVQVAKDQKLKLGTEENKIAAGKLLEEVILETQQNSLATERTAAMRSGDELLKGENMFIADAMKIQARMIEPYAQMASIRTQIRMAKESKNAAEVARLEKALAAARKQCVRASSAFVGVVIFNALLAYGFKVLFRRDEEETVGTVAADAFGNMIGGIPFVRDVYSFFVDGYEMENFALSTINDVMKTMADTADLLQDAANGKDISKQEALRAIRDVLYAMGQLSGVPTRNLYNNITGVINRVSPEAGYYIDGSVYKKNYSADLAAAIEADDEGMISLIASMMVEDKVGEVDSELALCLRELVEQGHDVLPRVLGDSITYDGEEIVLTRSQRERFKEVYGIAREQIVSMMQLRQFERASVEVRARAIRRIWSTYWDLAVDDVLGVDSSEKDVLFAEAIDMDKLALIAATAQEIKADVNEEGKAISGTRLRKIEAFVEGLKLKAAQKYMIMGYLGYKNKNGEDKVRSYISSISTLSKSEKEKLMGYAGYGSR